MPRIFDNIAQQLLPAIREGLEISTRADFCVGYFNLRGWRLIAPQVDHYSGTEGCACRVLIGMQSLPQDDLRELFGRPDDDISIDNRTMLIRKRELARDFRDQLTIGIPTSEDEYALRLLAKQIRAKKVVVKLFLRYQLHAKLYLLHLDESDASRLAFVGSSNLTMAGLKNQAELNIDVSESELCELLEKWFEDRWNDRFCLDISEELAEIIEESWAREELIPPYLIYLKMAYHLAEDAREGLADYCVPKELENILIPFQSAAVRIAAHHLHKRGGVLIGDVVGLGKTLVGTAVAKIFENNYGTNTLIISPRNLVPMWEDYRDHYNLNARVISSSIAIRRLPELRIFKVVLIDESQNLRNREGMTYKAIRQYILDNDSKVIMLSATPYNKSYTDLSNQLRLFIPDDGELTVRPENKLREMGEVMFSAHYQCKPNTLDAFDKSDFPDDWRELMRLFMVRRTRSFIMDNYAKADSGNGRKYLEFSDGRRNYFPTRIPKTVKFKIDDGDPNDQYARLYAQDVVDIVNSLNLPRYGLAKYLLDNPLETPKGDEKEILADLSRAGKRLLGYCRTGLFKRLESSGYVFLQSVSRHILRNFVYIHALENGLALPIGSQTADMLIELEQDPDSESALFGGENEDENDAPDAASEVPPADSTEVKYRTKAAEIYNLYAGPYKRRFRWLRPLFFGSALAESLLEDSLSLMRILESCPSWNPATDSKLAELKRLIQIKHPNEKVLVFSQFADTVDYLTCQLEQSGVNNLVSVTGNSDNPTTTAWRFSPIEDAQIAYAASKGEIRVLLATDVLSEGQNLQKCFTVVNFDLPWAIIRLIQRVGRVDRIGQHSPVINCYSFLPADGVERIINLRSRVRTRLRQNAEVVGADEAFFEDEDERAVVDLYNEKSGLLDGEDEGEVDLASYAFQIWKNAIDADPSLEKKVSELPSVVYSTKLHSATESAPPGALVYVRTGTDNDALVWVDTNGKVFSESQSAILRAAECSPGTPALPRADNHHELVAKGVERMIRQESAAGGQLGRTRGARYRAYTRLKSFLDREGDELFKPPELAKAVDLIYHFPLREGAKDSLNRQIKAGASDHSLAEIVLALYNEDKLCHAANDERHGDPRIICSMGLSKTGSGK